MAWVMRDRLRLAREMNEAVAQVFPLQQYKEGKDDGEQRCGQGLNDAAELVEASSGTANFANLDGMIGAGAQGLGLGFTAGRNSSGGVGDAEFVADLLNLALGPAVGRVAGTVERLHLLRDVAPVCGQVVGNGDKLGEDGPC